MLLSGPSRFTEMVSDTGRLDRAAAICLNEGEVVVLASERAVFELGGAACFDLVEVEAEIFARTEAIEQGGDPISQVGVDHVYLVLESIGNASARYPVGTRLSERDMVCLDEGDVVVVLGAGARTTLSGDRCISLRFREEDSPAYGRSVPSIDSFVNAPVRGSAPLVFRIASGSPDVLKRYTRGSVINRTASICLENGEQVTLIASNGQRVTYRGPGCARRNARPTEDNLGGFTFGWNTYGIAPEAAVLP